MRLVFVHYVFEDRGSAQDIHHFVGAARRLGHEVTLYAPSDPASAFNRAIEVGRHDAVVFIVEWTTDLQHGDHLDLIRMIGRVPRRRRIVVDCDGKYNEAISVAGDLNHPDADSARRWVDACDSFSDKICQPTLHPRRSNVRPFFFHAYHPGWEVPLDFTAKKYGVFYVGNNWFRWQPLHRLLRLLEPLRDDIGPVGLLGCGWDSAAPWANPHAPEDSYRNDPDYLRRGGIDVLPPVPFGEVVTSMGHGVVHPVIYRPLFDELELVTCRTFETPAANTLPLFLQSPTHVEEIYGPAGLEFLLPADDPERKVLDLVRRPERYIPAVEALRARMHARHSYGARLAELVELVEE
jgi:hypothetical protein